MAKHSFVFRTYATDETENWTLPDALKGATVFGLYYFLEGEATHLCSLTPSSRAEFLENVFLDADDPEAAQAHLDGPGDDMRMDSGGEWTSYFGFIRTAKPSPYVGPPVTFTLDSNDYDLDPELYASILEKALRYGDSPQKAHAAARYGCLRDFAYEVAREEFSANSPTEPPVCWGGEALASHKARKAMREARDAERYSGGPPLFAAAGVTAPLAASPSDLHAPR